VTAAEIANGSDIDLILLGRPRLSERVRFAGGIEGFTARSANPLEHYDLNGRLLFPEEWPVSRALRDETVLQSRTRLDTWQELMSWRLQLLIP
jgi:hypothetical protein